VTFGCCDGPPGAGGILGDAGEVARSEEQAEDLSSIEESDRPVKLKDICAATEKSDNSVHKLLAKLVYQCLVVQPMYGER
jgi:predicted MarR family transcription regulator